MKVKICGVQTVEAAKAVEESGADMIGFLFADSRRRVTAGEAEEIAGALGSGIRRVGVFVNAGKDEIDEAIRRAGLDYVQLHGDEDGDFARSLDARVIKVFSHASPCTFREMFSFPADFILIDSGSKNTRGGTGRAFDWSALDHPDIDKGRLILAGGLDAGNIRAAYSEVGPYAVDLSSGAETDGTKDPEKIKDIMNEVRSVNDGEDL
ncbi:N-(5'-phosphoribosyl)anthranilate isomerase [Salinicoccus sediminis]|uniref:N-(5'-phosphoribosyl)anthranilate isomerase n=1 Tax=Salinicoccus sediminis TaxID=1432562 RepID=A0A0M2SN56_9STAP|nr:phosphoribosylanthranilate isomerase [Salinicoccus sediminis]KKK34065.1 N-(5'-phosphoribosyl)anthranilate isomerase [Salinicoccus sediminis]